MKGNQGLDTLAALCGGASIPDESSKQEPASSTAPAHTPSAAAAAPVPTPWSVSRGLPVQASTAGYLAPGPRAGVPTDALAAMMQQIQGAAGLIPAAAAAVAAQPDPVQQLAYFHFVQAQAAAAASQLSQAQAPQQNGVPLASPGSLADPKAAAAIAVAAQQKAQQQTSQQDTAPPTQHQQQILPSAAPAPAATAQTSSSNGGTNSMQPPAPQVPTRTINSTSSSSSSTTSLANTIPIAAAPPKSPVAAPTPIARRPSFESEASSSLLGSSDDKKQQKRAANRRSAQLSRKRKKQFIEELKEENDELRRKEQILRSIPDLIVVFDSAGKLCFVSHSVRRFLEFSTQELEGSSFWDRLCDESVRLLKAAFMDALAARSNDSATVPLGSGVWELRLVDRDGSQKLVTLTGVVHFSGETPECVCSIRPREARQNHLQPLSGGEPVEKKARVDSSSDGGGTADSHHHHQPNLVRDAIKPQQSVISNGSSSSADDVSVKIARGKAPAAAPAAAAGGTRQISDGDSVVSESGSGSVSEG